METTIAVKESTAQFLIQLKKKLEARSMDELIMKVVQKAERLSASRFGSQRKALKQFREEERAQSHEL